MAEMLGSTPCQAMASSSSSSSSSSSLFSRISSCRSSLPLATSSLAASWDMQVKLTPCRANSTPHSAAPDEGIKWWERDWGAPFVDVSSTQELNDIVVAANGKLVIVKFFASWCGSCRALYPKLCKLAVQHEEIVFVKVNFDKNKELCKSLNIKVLPYFHLYRGELEQLDSFSCSIAKLQKLKDAIAKFNVSEHSTHCQKA